MDVNQIITLSDWAKKAEGKRLVMTKECLKEVADFAENLNIDANTIPPLIATLYDGAMDDDSQSWSDDKYLSWVEGIILRFANVPENLIMLLYNDMSKVMGKVSDKYLNLASVDSFSGN